MKYRGTAGLLVAALGVGLLGIGTPPAHASSKGRKNTALLLGGVAAYQLLKGKTTTGLAAGAGAAYAYKKYRDKRKDEKRRASTYAAPVSAAAYRTAYRNGRPSSTYRQQRQQKGRPLAWVDGRPIWNRDDYIDERTGQRSGDVQAPGTLYQRRDYGAAAREEAYRNSMYGQAEAEMNRARGHRR